jgi:hypothetical protein
MHLVEAEAIGPIEGEEPVVLPPRPPHRRVSVSFLFTMSVLIGTVVLIYVLLPARHDLLVTEAISHHRDPGAWDLEGPTPSEVHAWVIGLGGKDFPMPKEMPPVIGARRLEILKRRAALLRFKVGSDDVTYLVQHARGIGPDHVGRDDGDLHAEARRRGKFTIVAVGPAATAKTWIPVLLGP